MMVRIAWITAILLCLLVILLGLLAASDGGESSKGSPEAAFGPGFAFKGQEKAQSVEIAAPRGDRNHRARSQIPGESRPSTAAPSGSVGQTGEAGGSAPAATPEPKPAPAPEPKPTPAPQPKPAPAPARVPVSSQPASPEPVQPSVTVANNNDGP
jgi:outer membrane biosynthesis protein TonB